MFQGTPIGAAFCTMALLQSNPDQHRLLGVGVQLGRRRVSLYQHLGAGLGGGDYFAINSQFTSDNPSARSTRDPSAAFGARPQMKFTPMMFDGTHYVGKPAVTVEQPVRG